MKSEGNQVEIYTGMTELMKVKEAAEKAGYEVESAEIAYIPKNEVKIEDEAIARKILKIMDELEDSEDVGGVASNFDIKEEVLEGLG